MDDIFRTLIVEPFSNFVDRLLEFLPSLFLAALVLAAGVCISLVIRFILERLIGALGLDSYAEKAGVVDLLKKGGVTDSCSRLLARLVFWLLIIMFLIIALGKLDLPEVDHLLSQFFLYLPNIFATVAIVFIGYVLSNFLAKAALVWSVNAGITNAGTISKGVKLVVMIFTLTMALEQLGIGRGTVMMLFAIVFGGAVLAVALAFGLGGRDLAAEFLRKRMEEKRKGEDEIKHL